MHCTTAALDESKYEDIKEDLDEIITALASTFDISVQQHCSNCIKQFTSGPLDAVKPSLQTLNGFSQSCQKKVKVGVQTELVICGPSTKWITLCEETLEKIFDRAESMASKDSGFQEIQENVKIMLSYLESNAVFGGCKRKCIILFFVCDDYESFLNFLHKVECQEYTCYLGDLSNSLQGFFKPRNPISIKSKVTTECLQSALIDIIKTSSNEEEEQRHIVEISSEENIHDNKPMAPRDVNREMKLIKQSKTTLFLNHELISWEALPQMIQTFQGKQFSDSLTKVAGSLSHLYGGEITLKASLNVGAVLEALEESVSDDVTVDRRTIKSESIYAKTPKENDFPLLPVQETPSFELLDPAKKQRRHTIDMGFEIPASQYSKAKVRETSSLKPLSHVKKVRRNTIDIGFGKPALQHSKAKAEQAFAAQTKGHSRDNNEPSCFNEVDPNNDDEGSNTYEHITFSESKEQRGFSINENEMKKGSNISIKSTSSSCSSTKSVTYESQDEDTYHENMTPLREEEYYCKRKEDVKRNLRDNPRETFLICNSGSAKVEREKLRSEELASKTVMERTSLDRSLCKVEEDNADLATKVQNLQAQLAEEKQQHAQRENVLQAKLIDLTTRHLAETNMETERLRQAYVQVERLLDSSERANRQKVKGMEETIATLKDQLEYIQRSARTGEEIDEIRSMLDNSLTTVGRDPSLDRQLLEIETRKLDDSIDGPGYPRSPNRRRAPLRTPPTRLAQSPLRRTVSPMTSRKYKK